MHQKRRDLEIFLAIKDPTINKTERGRIFQKIISNHKSTGIVARRHVFVNTTSAPAIFTDTDAPARFITEKQEGTFVYFIASELTESQFDAAVATELPFGIVQPGKNGGYITTCYNPVYNMTEKKPVPAYGTL